MAPCKDCMNRTLKCHSTCADYLEFRRWAQIKNERERQRKRSDAYYRSVPHDMAYSKYHL